MKLLLNLLLTICLSSSSLAATEAVNIVFVGDVMLAETVGQQINIGKDPFKNFNALFKSADLVIGNLECYVGTGGKPEDKPYTFRASNNVINVLKKHFSAVSLANNHSMDFGQPAFERMLKKLDAAGLKYFGAGFNRKDAHKPIIFHVKGKKIAVLAYDIFQPRSYAATRFGSGVAWGDADYIAHDIKTVKANEKPDYLLVYPHWGIEYDQIASSEQRNLANLMVLSGADAVIGGHPHVVQNIEVIAGKPVFYSLGNFVFNGFEDRDTRTGWILQLTLTEHHQIDWTIHESFINKFGIPHYVRKLTSQSSI